MISIVKLNAEEVVFSLKLLAIGERAFRCMDRWVWIKKVMEKISPVCLEDLLEGWSNPGDEKELFERVALEAWGREAELPCGEIHVIILCVKLYSLIVKEKRDNLLYRYEVVLDEEGWRECRRRVTWIGTDERSRNQVSGFYKHLLGKTRVKRQLRYISDCHFFHTALLTELDFRPFQTVEEMNEHMVNRWNQTVGEDDRVYILGDFSVGRGRETNEILKRLCGEKHLILGNHDHRYLSDPGFDPSLFASIQSYEEIVDGNQKVLLFHYPLIFYNKQYQSMDQGEASPSTYMLYGHVHDSKDERFMNRFMEEIQGVSFHKPGSEEVFRITTNQINCFCMYSGYAPLTLEEWIELDRSRREKMS